MAKVSWEYRLENWPEPQWRSAIRMVPSSWGFLTGMVRRRMESMSWKIAVLAPIPRARVRTEMMVKPGLRRRNRKAWRRSRQNEVIASPCLYQTMGEAECHVELAPRMAIQRSFFGGEGRPPRRRPYTGLSRLGARGLRFGQGLARDHFVAVGSHIDKGCDDHGHLLHVRLLNAFIDVHVRVVGARVVVQRILDELKAGEAHSIEGEVISSAGVADGERVHAEIVEGDHPRGKYRGHHFIPLQIDAANLAGAIVDVVVGIELGVLRRRIHHFGIGEMLFDVGAGAEQALLFAGP